MQIRNERYGVVPAHRYALVSIVYVGSILPPGDGGLGVATRWLAFQHSRFPFSHHHIGRVLSEIISQDCNWRKKGNIFFYHFIELQYFI